MTHDSQPIQNFYPEEATICYGCGRNNAHGHHIQTFWDGTTGTATFTPEAYHTAFPGVVYGGLIASIIDCHAMGTAIAAMHDRFGRTWSTDSLITCVTGNLNVTYHKPTPMGEALTVTATIDEITDKKAIVACSLTVNGVETVTARVVAVRVKARRDDALS